MIHCPYHDGLKNLFLLSKSIELLVLQADAHEQHLDQPYIKSATDRKKLIEAKELLTAHLNQPPTIMPPPAAREPSFKPPPEPPADEELVLPRDDDDYSPAHADGEVGTGVGDDEAYTLEDVEAANAERDTVEEALEQPADDTTEEKKEAS